MSNITIVGLGSVGLSNLIFFGANHQVHGDSITAFDIDSEVALAAPDRIQAMINNRKNKDISLGDMARPINYTDIRDIAYADVDIIIFCLPTPLSDDSDELDVEALSAELQLAYDAAPKALLIIRSTVPVGFTADMMRELDTKNIIFAPEFIREGFEVDDAFTPDRVLIGGYPKNILVFSHLISPKLPDKYSEIISGHCDVMEAAKLYSNAYLAMRVAFFNEVDTFALRHNMSGPILNRAITGDKRIGRTYSNPSFGFGGSCLPKDLAQINSQDWGPDEVGLMEATIESNKNRCEYLVDDILSGPYNQTVGIYRLDMKRGHSNSRDASAISILAELIARDVPVIVFDDNYTDPWIYPCKLVTDISDFARECGVIVANRIDDELAPYRSKVFSRDFIEYDEHGNLPDTPEPF